VAARGHTQWVRNLRVAGEAELRVGRRSERVAAIELSDADKPPVLRVGADSSDAELAAVAERHPVFVLAGSGSAGA